MISAHGISLEVPRGWEARIFRRGDAGAILHLATFPLHEGDGDFGAAATGRMRPDDRFLALLEFRPDGRLRAGEGLFAHVARLPRMEPRHFGPRQLQVTRPGQLGWQRFFTLSGRPCCLYAVVRPGRHPAHRLVGELDRVARTLRLLGP